MISFSISVIIMSLRVCIIIFKEIKRQSNHRCTFTLLKLNVKIKFFPLSLACVCVQFPWKIPYSTSSRKWCFLDFLYLEQSVCMRVSQTGEQINTQIYTHAPPTETGMFLGNSTHTSRFIVCLTGDVWEMQSKITATIQAQNDLLLVLISLSHHSQ